MKILVVKTDFIERRFGCTNDYISIISKFSLRIQFAKFSLRMIWVFKVGILLSIFMESLALRCGLESARSTILIPAYSNLWPVSLWCSFHHNQFHKNNYDGIKILDRADSDPHLKVKEILKSTRKCQL